MVRTGGMVADSYFGRKAINRGWSFFLVATKPLLVHLQSPPWSMHDGPQALDLIRPSLTRIVNVKPEFVDNPAFSLLDHVGCTCRA